ncbi:MAG: PAS domain S-box protein [Halioglobus sp.]|nr:PAS domain S-box protein [Halioglobus sp.]
MVKHTQGLENTILSTLSISLLYFSAAQVGLLLELAPHQIILYWPASGVALAAALIFDKRALLGLMLGAFATAGALVFQQPFKPRPDVLFALFVAAAMMIMQPLIALTLLKRLVSSMPFWMHIRTLYQGLAVLLLASVIPAGAGAGALFITGIVDGNNIIDIWMFWTMAGLLGMITVAPILYQIARRFNVAPTPSYQAPLYTMVTFSLACLAVVVIFITVSNAEHNASDRPLDQNTKIFAERFQNSTDQKNSSVITPHDNNLNKLDTNWKKGRTTTETKSMATNQIVAAITQSVNLSKPLFASIITLVIGLLFTHIVYAHEKHQKESLRTRAFHDAIVVSALQPFVHLDENGFVLEWNKAAHEVFGWTLEQIQYKKLAETLVPARFREAHENGMERFRKTGEGLVIGNIVELEGSCADGTELPIELLINAIQTEDGWHFFAFIHDISERKRGEDALQAAHKKYTGLFEASPDAIVTYNQEGNIEDVNIAAIALFGWSREEMLSMKYEAIIADRSKTYFFSKYNNPDYVNPLELSQANQSVFANRRDGSEFPFEVVINAQETETGTKHISVIRDITEQVEAAKIKESNQKLETLGELTGVLAHEFNNLLTIIIGNLDLVIARQSETPLNETIQNRLKAAQNAATRGTDVVRSLLAAGTDQPISQDYFNVAPMIADMLPKLQVAAGENITLSVETKHESLPVKSNRKWLSEAVQNLVINAREAIVGKGQIEICLNRVQSSNIVDKTLALSDGDYIVVSVSDTGSGMSDSDMQKSIDPFFTTKKASGHKGIGLSVVSRMAKQLGGAATVASRPKKGTVVQVFLPATDSSNILSDSSDLNSDAAGKNVLVVDDQTEILTLTVSWLEKSGYRVKSADNADSALGIIDSSVPPIDLLITDMVMPSIDGDSLTRFARRCNPSIKILYMTGFLAPSRGNSDDTADIPILEKPFRKNKFLATVRSIFDSVDI